MVRSLTRRAALRGAVAAAAIAAPYVRGTYAAGKLSVSVLDHAVPAVNQLFRAVCREWAERHRIDITIDSTAGAATAAAEVRAQAGHDIMVHPLWQIFLNRRALEPVDDVIADLIAANGPVSPAAEYLGRSDGVWRGIPATIWTTTKPCCSRLDLYRQHCGLDLAAIFPPHEGRDEALVAGWNWDRYLETACALFKAGHPVGLSMGKSSDAVDWVAALFQSFGAVLGDRDGTIRVDSDETRAALAFAQRLMAFNPQEAFTWDDAGNNRWLISGRGGGIMNPPSAWAAAQRENPPVAAMCWTHDMPRGPKGRFVAAVPCFYGIWSFAASKAAARELVTFLSQEEQAQRLIGASEGMDAPAFARFDALELWRTVGPPPGTLFNYPARGDETPIVPGFPARLDVAFQIYSRMVHPTMVGMLTRSGDSIDSVIGWARRELEAILCLRRSDHCA